MTKYEKEIFNLISSSYDHLSAEQVFSRLKEKYPAMVLARVYNNLNKLWEAGLIRKITVEGVPDRYDRTQRHDHMVCRGCGRLKDVSFEDLTSKLSHPVPGAGRPDEILGGIYHEQILRNTNRKEFTGRLRRRITGEEQVYILCFQGKKGGL